MRYFDEIKNHKAHKEKPVISEIIRHIAPQCKIIDFLSVPHLETIIAPHLIQDVLTSCDAWEQREKKISMQSKVYLIIALSLYPTSSTREVWRRLMEGLSPSMTPEEAVLTAGALCQRRQQLGVTPLRQLFTRCVHPLFGVWTSRTSTIRSLLHPVEFH